MSVKRWAYSGVGFRVSSTSFGDASGPQALTNQSPGYTRVPD